MKGGNGVREANVVTLCSKCEYRIALAKNASGSRTKSAEEILATKNAKYAKK